MKMESFEDLLKGDTEFTIAIKNGAIRSRVVGSPENLMLLFLVVSRHDERLMTLIRAIISAEKDKNLMLLIESLMEIYGERKLNMKTNNN